MPTLSRDAILRQKSDAENNKPEIVHVSGSYSGPLPLPSHLKAYEDILPGAAERILVMAEQTVAHAIQLEKDQQRLDGLELASNMRNSLLGIVFAFIICLMFLLAGVYFIANGKEVGGAILGAGGLAGIVSTFIYGTRKEFKKENEKPTPKPKRQRKG